MVSLLLIIILLMSLISGYRRGLILQLVYLAGVVISFIVAYLFYKDVAEWLQLIIPFPQLSDDADYGLLLDVLGNETVYYNGLAFIGLFIVTKIVTHIIGSMFQFLAHLPVLNLLNRWAGAAIGFLEGIVILVIVVHLAALIQWDFIQAALQSSAVAQWIFAYTPVLSELLIEWFEESWNN
ncbi:CvpA family protein [Salisediminibacterium halotolerans]|uniref:Uncharacterized membrane protein, required for colicin V production n=1 Tax=Salisediminibacterium halotolerans TaxID=517425 RepID=A0A1H9U1R5_9BACI|nr:MULTISPECIES: CvpA family protein [Salisediminibacterium]RLJ69437.1 putative membrane protein required for colicin V production [Actinophytocola xinjiangensis]RPE84057.1 putative membrane protein required for colicin V production [Salisediminibacterium halotolerans]TWG32512.1 putative membrane protein required for colicin V production [Salisediminibacterium halotolerans]SES03171.1 Uncharacterized membrane protein, required for colicin V production [Salisediminibacterium haloalkalitolerans]G